MNQWLRRLTQLFALAVVIVIPFMSLYAAVMQSGTTFPVLEGNMIGGMASDVQPTAMPTDQATNPVVQVAFHAIQAVTAGMENPLEFLFMFKGGNWSLVIFGVQISDPLAFVASALASRHFEFSLFISILIPIGLAMVAGPVWCGWLCPINTLGEVSSWIRKQIQALGLDLPDYQITRQTKYALLVAGIGSALVFQITIFPYLLPYVLFSREMFRIIFFHTMGYGALILGVIFLADVFVWRRGFCRYLCPGGATLSILGSSRLINIERDKYNCISGCVECEEVCEPGMKPYLDDEGIGVDCTNCGKCIANCPGDALEYDVTKPDKPEPTLSVQAKAGLVVIGALTAGYVIVSAYVLLP